MQRLPLAKFFAGSAILWGSIVVFHGACKSFGGLMAVRFLLGAIEVSAAPCVIYILGSWYTKREQISRVAVWYTSSGWAHVFGGFFAWCIYHSRTFRWQALFIFEGGLTIIVGLFMWFFLAASPTDAGWLDEDEKVIALERCRDNRTGTEVWKFNKKQLIEAFCDPRFYLIFLFLVSTGLPNGGLTVFGKTSTLSLPPGSSLCPANHPINTATGPSIISQFGFSAEQTTLLSMAPGAAAVVGSILVLVIAEYTCRTVAGIFSLVLSVTGTAMMLGIPPENYVARYGGYILTLQCMRGHFRPHPLPPLEGHRVPRADVLFPVPVSVLFVITFMTSGVGGSTKKLAFGASYQLGYTVGNIIGPQTYRSSDAPDYYVCSIRHISIPLCPPY